MVGAVMMVEGSGGGGGKWKGGDEGNNDFRLFAEQLLFLITMVNKVSVF